MNRVRSLRSSYLCALFGPPLILGWGGCVRLSPETKEPPPRGVFTPASEYSRDVSSDDEVASGANPQGGAGADSSSPPDPSPSVASNRRRGTRQAEGAEPQLEAVSLRARPKRSPGQGKPKRLRRRDAFPASPSGPGTPAHGGFPDGGKADFQGRDARVNGFRSTAEDRWATFAVDVDTAAYSIARRTLLADRMPTPSLVRVEELLNYFKYDYDPPTGNGELFSVQADGARSPIDSDYYLLRVGIQARTVQSKDRLPANLVFLVDTSCSMTSSDKLELAKRGLEFAIDRLGERDQVAITTYAGSVRSVLEPTRGDQKMRIREAIRELQSGGGTAMASGMELAYRQAASMLGSGEVSRVVVLSDGDANIGATSAQEILRRVQGYVKEGVTLSTIGFGQGNYKDATMEQLANKGNGNYHYVDSMRQAERVFGRDLTKMIQDVAQDVKIQVEFDRKNVQSYRLVGYENRAVRDHDFRNDRVDAGEIGAGHQVTALFELMLDGEARGSLATVRVRAKKPRGMRAREMSFPVPSEAVVRPFEAAPRDLRFAAAVMGGAELLRRSPHAAGWSFARVLSIISDTRPFFDEDRSEFMDLMKKAAWLSGEHALPPIGLR